MPKLVEGEGPIPCPGMIIGEAPGAEEEFTGRPFMGKSGSLLDEALAVAGIDRDKVFITNIYKLRPPGNRVPDKKEIASHAMLLNREIKQVKPKVILTLGKTATDQFLTLEKGIVRQRGMIRTFGDYLILPTIHPSFVLRSRKVRFELFLKDVMLFGRVSGLGERSVGL